jgi:hypothetical protein
MGARSIFLDLLPEKIVFLELLVARMLFFEQERIISKFILRKKHLQ